MKGGVIKLIHTFDDKPINILSTEEIEYMANSSDLQLNVSANTPRFQNMETGFSRACIILKAKRTLLLLNRSICKVEVMNRLAGRLYRLNSPI